jgi:hypothetical protein
MVCGGGCDEEVLSSRLRGVSLREVLEKDWERFGWRQAVRAHFDVLVSQLARLYELPIERPEVLERQLTIEMPVDVQDRLRVKQRLRALGPVGLLCPFLRSHVGDRQSLPGCQVRIRRKVLTHRPLDVGRQGVLPLDPVRVVRVHRSQERTEGTSNARVREARELPRCLLDLVGEFAETPQRMVVGDERLEVYRHRSSHTGFVADPRHPVNPL